MGETPNPGTPNPDPAKPKRSKPKPQVTWRGIVDDPGEPRGSFRDRIRGYLSGGGSGGGNGGGNGPGGDGFPDPYAGLRRHRRRLLGLGVIVVVLIGLVITTFHIVPAGNVIVPQTFGDAQAAKTEGLRATWPWPITRINTMSIRVQNYTMSSAQKKGTDPAVLVLGFDGASAKVDATVLYRLDPKDATRVFRAVGTNYLATVVVPSSRTCIREAYASVDLVRAATGDFPGISEDVTNCLKSKIEPIGITVVDFQLRDLLLSPNIQKAVDVKVAADQSIVAAQHNAESARLQAKGQVDAAQILACGGVMTSEKLQGKLVSVVKPNLSDTCVTPPLDSSMLTFNYIQTLRDIIANPKATIILPNGDSGQPIINVPAGSGADTSSGGAAGRTAQPNVPATPGGAAVPGASGAATKP